MDKYKQKYEDVIGWIKDIYPSLDEEMKKDAERRFKELVETEDEKMSREIIDFIQWEVLMGSLMPEHREKSDSWLAWLEKQGEQKPAEWSEEDEAAYDKALDAYYYKDCNDKDDVVSALKDLTDLIAKHRKTIPPYQRWKPSEEQMKSVNEIVNFFANAGNPYMNDHLYNRLVDLRNDLKKL